MRKFLAMLVPILTLLLAISLPAAAHHVHHEVTRGEAVVVSLAYGNGSPLAFDRYDIFAGDGEASYQSGKTDAQGRIVFLPDHAAIWRVKVFSEDGHGADFTFEAGPVNAPAAGPSAVEPEEEVAVSDQEQMNTSTQEVAKAEKKRFVERFAGPVFGVGIILSVFALLALFIRRRR